MSDHTRSVAAHSDLGAVGGQLGRLRPDRRSLLLLLDDVAGDGRAAVVHRLGPFQLDEVAVPVGDLGAARGVRLVWRGSGEARSQTAGDLTVHNKPSNRKG